eukprot:scaffold17287_cov105-Isochrysis_galbana.AAC.1
MSPREIERDCVRSPPPSGLQAIGHHRTHPVPPAVWLPVATMVGAERGLIVSGKSKCVCGVV